MKKVCFENILSACLISIILSGCASFTGYPSDSHDTEAELAVLNTYGGAAALDGYFRAVDPLRKRFFRDNYVNARIAQIDIDFERFKMQLNSEKNVETLTTESALLVLTGLTATTGGATTKAALGAAAAGVTGVSAHINKDLYYEKTVPALLSMFSACHATKLAVIEEGLRQPDENYPLPRALIDIDEYRDCGSIPTAISGLTARASSAKIMAHEYLKTVSTNQPAKLMSNHIQNRESSRYRERKIPPALLEVVP